MAKPTIEFVRSPNFRAGRRKLVSCIVVHYTGSLSIESTVSWFARKEAAVSAHYVIGREGRVVQMVREEDVAWHAGRSTLGPDANVNDFSIGIELVGTMDSGFTDRQLASFYEILAQLVVKYRIMPERVVGHLHIAPGRKIDPDGIDAQFPWLKCKMVAQAAYASVVKTGPLQA